MPGIDFGGVLRGARESDPTAIPEVLATAASGFGGTDVVVYLVDFGQTTLEPLPDRSSHAELPASEDVGASMAGKAFKDQTIVSAERGANVRVWIPIVEGSDRTGVVALTLQTTNDSLFAACEELGLLAGYLIAAHARCTDLYNLHRRRRSLSLAASMQWDLLPPLVLTTPAVAVAGLLEPAYDVGGDCFDYAANGAAFDIGIFDAVGHDLESAAIAALAVGAYRHGRREAQPLAALHRALGDAISSQYDDSTFATGVLARVDTGTGVFSWTNAGHPCPLLVRGGHVVRELQCQPTSPWGTFAESPMVASEALEPGDCVLLYTDGVTEARTPDGEQFGRDRLIDIIDGLASELLRPEEIVRVLIRSVLEHQSSALADDASVVMLRWSGAGGPT
jgi:serine phosphatase RsbU (regulator of sigma subunit)